MSVRPTLLVTGGAGFIGAAAAPELLRTYDVVALDNLHPQVHSTRDRPAALPEGVRLVTGDVTVASVWDHLLQDVAPDVVLHLAAETGTGQSLDEATRHASVNVVGTTQMLDAFGRAGAGPSRIVLTSSRAVYGEGAWIDADGSTTYPGQRGDTMLTEGEWDFPGLRPTAMDARSVAPLPVSVYGATKLAQEQLLGVWGRALGVEVAVLRLQNVYGPGQSLTNPYTGIMSLFCRMAMGGRSIPLFEDGRVRRDFVLIDDVVDAVVAAVTAQEVAAAPLDIGSGETQTIGAAADLIARRYGAPAPHVTGQFRHGDVRHAWAETAPATAALGWRPRFSLEEGVERLARWIDAQPGVTAA
ncbi:NAD-dependent epimerase/dehydratase family protein [Serinibacter arcticus]|uniref:NAD-dependent epimerase/dehydratase family protein n=1 Tax=Serinibacter arcticus TaxID=1655435 RepID=A0A4Z1DWX5_9MICO|nr:NAD-dependent epimerase/dehydratase family protein [Serinibacter arcticus]TGO04076.1 NAD-dependent epimerase/dehydratase family protein [Serinibacter arcticus]